MAAIASLIYLLTFAIGPTAQQVIQFRERLSDIPETGTLPICASGEFNTAVGRFPDQTVSPEMVGVAFEAIFQKRAVRPLSASCRTGNCTFKAYQTLEVCSRCEDITNTLRLWTGSAALAGKGGTNTDSNDKLEFQDGKWRPPKDCHSGSDYCIYTLPNGLKVDNDLPKVLEARSDNLSLAHPELAKKISFLNFTAIVGSLPANAPYIAAVECSMYFCVNAYTASVVLNAVQETRIASSERMSVSESDAFPIRNPPSMPDVWIIPDVCYRDGIEKRPPYKKGDGCPVEVPFRNGTALANSLGPYLNGSGHDGIGGRGNPIYWQQGNRDVLDALRGKGTLEDLNATFVALADSLSRYVRSTRSVCAGSVVGQVQAYEVFMHIEWPWLAVHAVLVLAVIVVLLVTVFTTRANISWKSSIMPYFFIGQSGSVRLDLCNSGQELHMANMEDEARDVKTRLAQTPLGWRLLGSEETSLGR
jgi:hypothetical protein